MGWFYKTFSFVYNLITIIIATIIIIQPSTMNNKIAVKK